MFSFKEHNGDKDACGYLYYYISSEGYFFSSGLSYKTMEIDC